jgi:hypothetical protein
MIAEGTNNSSSEYRQQWRNALTRLQSATPKEFLAKISHAPVHLVVGGTGGHHGARSRLPSHRQAARRV